MALESAPERSRDSALDLLSCDNPKRCRAPLATELQMKTMTDNNAQFDGSIPVHYDRFLGPILLQPYAVDLAARLETHPEASVLELACGTGILTEILRNHLRPSARLTATDLNQPMLDYARAKLAGVSGITWGLADASGLEFTSNSFDAVLCQFGLMFVPDKASALSEIHRVLRHDGVFLFNVWDAIQTNELPRIAHETVDALFPANPPDFYQVPFSLHDQDELAVMLQAAGFIDLEFAVVSKVCQSHSARDAAMGLIYGNPIVDAIRERNTIDIETVVDALEKAIAMECGNAPALAKMQAVIIRARPNKRLQPTT
jgi:ubiquinone/menaquinone biosynthesis C-methylase UbiE